MTKKKALQNPAVVVGLCGVALVALYFNTIAPLISGRSDTTASAESNDVLSSSDQSSETSPPDMQIPSETTVSGAASEDSAISSASDTLHTSLASIGWKRTTIRNPFVRGSNCYVQLLPKTADSVVASSVTRSSKPQHPRAFVKNVAVPSPLQAISRGPQGLIALFESQIVSIGDTCSTGIVTAIDLSTVTIKTSHGIRIFRLNKSSSGANQ